MDHKSFFFFTKKSFFEFLLIHSYSNVKAHILQTDFLVDVILERVLVLKLFLAILAGVNGRLGVLDDHVTAETEGVGRDLAAQLASVEFGVVVGIYATLQKLHHSKST